jgi:predicted transcriptional regulator
LKIEKGIEVLASKEDTMSNVGVPVGGLKTVGQIVATNNLTFQAGQNGLAIAVELLSTHTAGAPVIDHEGKYIGFINEFDVMKALGAGKELSNLMAEDLMRIGPIAVHSSTTIEDAAKRMEERCVLNLPVEKDGKVAYSVSRHDLLRAWIGLGLGMGLDP